jgi:putative transposase
LFRYELEPGQVDEIRQARNGNHALGNTFFAERIGEAVGRRINPGKAGRPGKRAEPESGGLFE